MIKTMEKIIMSLKGNVLGFGIEEVSFLKAIRKNKNIKECGLLNSIDLDKLETGFGKNKKISVKKLKKIYGYKNIDTLIIDQKKCKYLEKKLRSSWIYLTKGTIYLYHIEDALEVIKKMKRYQVNIEKIVVEEEIILKIDVNEAKPNRLFDKLYFLIDSVSDLIDMISGFLVS